MVSGAMSPRHREQRRSRFFLTKVRDVWKHDQTLVQLAGLLVGVE